MITTYDDCLQFFNQCKNYWKRNGDPDYIASCKAFWWDCVECWNFDKSWNDAKREFAQIHGYSEGQPVPDASIIERGWA